MWDFPQYISRERAFNGLSRDFLEAAGAGAGVEAGPGARASRTVLKICCISSLEYLGTLVVAAWNFGLRGLLVYSKDSDLKGKEELKGVTEGVTEEATEGRSRRRQSRSRTEVILMQAFF